MNNKRRLKIAYTTINDVRNQNSFNAGTRYYIAKYLEKHLGDVDFICPLETIQNNFIYRSKRRFYTYLCHQRYLPDRAPAVLDRFADQIKKRIEGKHHDLIFSPANEEISHLDTNIPIVFYTDAIFDSMVDFYSKYTNLCKESIKDGHNQEQAALDRAKLAIFSSRWAADAAIKNFDVDPNKIKFIPFGANLPVIPEREVVERRRNNGLCNLLFVGTDWERKGGPLAVRIVEILNNMGMKSRLFVCSRIPKEEPLNEFVVNIGLLDRNKPAENRKMEELFSHAHFLILPTKADCTPGVFREAAAFGLPVITTDVGGNTSVVEKGKSGIILSKDADPEEYGNMIFKSFKDSERYRNLCFGSREMFEQVLNWDTSIERVSSLIRACFDSYS
jgi:glycosyltransferase involved in cell wall biosynthesis